MKIVFDIAFEERLEERDHDAPLVLGDEALLVDPHIAAVAQHLQGGGVGGGTADAEFFHALHERGFRKARRRLGEMLGGNDLALFQLLVRAHGGEAVRVLVLVRVVLAFLINGEEAVKFYHGAGGAKLKFARARLGLDVDSGALEFCRLHLARDGANPDQLVEFRLIRLEELRDVRGFPREVGRAHGFVRFLRVLRLVFVDARRVGNIFLAVFGFDHLARAGDRARIKLDAVGSHIGDEADGFAADVGAFVQALRDPHGDRGRKTKFAAGFLLHRRGRERRVGIALRGLCLDRGDGELRVLQCLLEIGGFRAGADIEAGDLLAVGADETRFESFVARRGQRRRDRPVFLRNKLLDSSSRSQTSRSATDCTRPAEREPGSFRHSTGERVKPTRLIEGAACEISVHKRRVDLARMRHRFRDGLFGDGVEYDALDFLAVGRAFFLEDFEDMPRDRFALAIGVGGEDQLVGALQRLCDLVDAGLGAAVDLPDHLEVVVGRDRAVFRRQVAHMAIGGEYPRSRGRGIC